MTSYEEKLGKMEEDEISGEKILTDRQVEMLQAEDERNYYSSRDENPYRQYQKITNRLKKFKKKQVIFQKRLFLMSKMPIFDVQNRNCLYRSLQDICLFFDVWNDF